MHAFELKKTLLNFVSEEYLKDFDKIFNLRTMFTNANRAISLSINEVNNNVIRVSQIQAKTKKHQ